MRGTPRGHRSLALLGILLAVGCGSADTPVAPATSAAPATAVATPTPPPTSAAPGASGDVLLDTDGALAATDTRAGAAYVDRYQLHVDAGQRVRVTVTAAALDTVLQVTPPSAGGEGGTLTNDDANGDRTRSEIELTTAQAGDLKIAVTSFVPGATGAYHVHVARVTDAAPPPSPLVAAVTHHQLPSGFRSFLAGTTPSVPSGEPVAVAVHVGDRVQATLAQGNPTLRSGEFANYYSFAAPSAGTYTVTMSSSRVDSFLIITTPSGEQLHDDDGGGGRDAMVRIDAPAAGEYRIAASTYRVGEVGPYELGVVSGASAPTAPTATAPVAPPSAPPSTGAAAPRTEHGELASGDQQLRSGEFFDEFDYDFPRGTRVHLEAQSTAFDTYLILRTPDGQQTDNDDQSPGVLNAAMDFVASQDGQYRVLVTSYAPGMSGAYDLVVGTNGASVAPPTVAAPTPSAPGAPIPPGAPAAPRAPGDSTRVWVVSAGITDYPDPANHLPECANDARKIVEALHNQGLSTEETEFLLVDRAATREGIHHAIEQVASQIQPNDTFVFFWSGHGGQSSTTTTDPNEIDGHDEYIYVYDGEILDDQMAQWIDSVHGLTLFTLDSCYSGGFAKDVVHRPGVVGMFSSEEDVTSGVALQFQAGGYLSHFLRLGIQGGADDDPSDGTTTVGELTHYVWQQWAQHATDVRMSGGYQQLVEERGSVHTDVPFWQLTGASARRGSADPSSRPSGRGGRRGSRRGR
jgi:hypothetical protein